MNDVLETHRVQYQILAILFKPLGSFAPIVFQSFD